LEKNMNYWKAALIWGLGSFAILLAILFIYGLFNRFEFIHAATQPGIDAGVAYAFFGGLIIGPWIFLAGGAMGAARVWWRKRKQKL
jgi:hypothetical protein